MLSSSSVENNVPYANSQKLPKTKRATANLGKNKYMSVMFENGTLVSGIDVEEWHPNTDKLESTVTKVLV